jgi:sulfite exporter TauE/SafE
VKNHFTSFVIGILMLIAGFYLLNFTTFRLVEIPAIIAGFGFVLVAIAAMQKMFKNRLPENTLFFGWMFIVLPVMLVWRAIFHPWVLILLVGGIFSLITACRKRKPAPAGTAGTAES